MTTATTAQTTILLIRHGRTVWNKDTVFRGRADIPLDDTGLQQAEALASALQREDIARVVSSPLSRALQTATAVAAAHGLTVATDDAFIDLDFGDWQGLQVAEVENRYPELHSLWQLRPRDVHFPGGETLDEVADRSFAALTKLVTTHAAETIALVAHRVINKVLICRILGLDTNHFWQIRQDTACLNRLSFDGELWVLDALNDTSHIRHLNTMTADF
jgi:phosphoserine phosphatase